MTTDDAERVARWRYGGAWSIYDLGSAQPLIGELSSYRSVTFGDELGPRPQVLDTLNPARLAGEAR